MKIKLITLKGNPVTKLDHGDYHCKVAGFKVNGNEVEIDLKIWKPKGKRKEVPNAS